VGIYFRRVDQLHIHSPRIAKSLATFIPYAPANPSAEKRFTRAPATVTDKMVSDRTSSSDGPERPRLKAEKNDTTKKQPSGSGGCFRSRFSRRIGPNVRLNLHNQRARHAIARFSTYRPLFAWCPSRNSIWATGSTCRSSWPVGSFAVPIFEPPARHRTQNNRYRRTRAFITTTTTTTSGRYTHSGLPPNNRWRIYGGRGVSPRKKIGTNSKRYDIVIIVGWSCRVWRNTFRESTVSFIFL